MDELVLRSLKGETSDAEELALKAWREQSPANETHYQEVIAVWELRKLQRPLLEASAVPTADRVLSRGWRSDKPARAPFALKAIAVGLAAAASIVLAFGLGQSSSRGRPLHESPLELVTNGSEMVSARLGDGTIVRLGGESRLKLNAVDTREVWLEGRAFFAVAKQHGREFRVHSSAGEMVVLGTRFDVETRNRQLKLVVVEGRVRLTAGAAAVDVGAGQMTEVVGGGPPTVARPVDVAGAVEWLGSFVAFEATPMHQVAGELQNRFGITLVVEDSLLASRPITGWFNGHTADGLVSAICFAAGARCTTAGSTVRMRQ